MLKQHCLKRFPSLLTLGENVLIARTIGRATKVVNALKHTRRGVNYR